MDEVFDDLKAAVMCAFLNARTAGVKAMAAMAETSEERAHAYAAARNLESEVNDMMHARYEV